MQSAPVAERRGIGEEHEVPPRHEGARQPRCQHLDLGLGGQRRVGDGAEARDVEHMVGPEPRTPGWEDAGDLAPHRLPALQFHAVPLAIVEANGLHAASSGRAHERGRRSRSCPPENNTSAAPSSFHTEIRKPRCCKALWRTRLLVEYCIFLLLMREAKTWGARPWNAGSPLCAA